MDKPIRILMVSYEYPPIGGGGGNAVYNILKEFASLGGVSVDLVTSYAGKGVAVENWQEGIDIHKVGINKKSFHHWRKTEVLCWMFKANRHYKKLLKANEYDIAHCFFAFPSGWFCRRSKKKLPYIISLRGSDVPGYNNTLGMEYFLLSKVFKSIWQNASCIVANSKGLAKLATEFMPQLRYEVIPNGVRLEDFSEVKVYKSDDAPLKLLTVGRLVSRKRIDIVIKAVRILTEWGFNVSLDIAGDGVEAENLKSLAKDCEIEDKINFLGIVERSKIGEVYAKADIFVMCSEHEGMSNALLEAMASALPVVTSSCEGTAELIDDNGLIVEDMNEKNLASALGKLIRDNELLEKYSQAARQTAGRFSWENTAKAYLEKYRQTIKKPNS